MLAVINIDSLMCRRLCGKLHCGRSNLLFALQQSSIDNQLLVENRDFFIPNLHSTSPLRRLCRNIAMTFGVEKLEWCGYPMVNFFEDTFIHFNRTHERDRQTDRQTLHDAVGTAYA